MTPSWYLARLARMSPDEMLARAAAAARKRWWRRPGRRPDGGRHLLAGPRRAAVGLPRTDIPSFPAVVAAAELFMAGHWPIFALRPASVGAVPDWHRDPLTGIRADPAAFAFALPHRDESAVGNVKYVWELSRHQATTVLAAAWWLTGDDRFADRAADQLRAWWAQNPFATGIHWTSGIEVGLRLLSWTWIRALLADWPGVAALFDEHDAFAAQLYGHMAYLRGLPSGGSSANNHQIAELAGLVAACTAFPWFRDSAAWGAAARDELAAAAERQTGADGLNREQASEYGPFVWEMLAAATFALRLAGAPAEPRIEAVLVRMADALAASTDAAGQPPRFGDGDDGRGLLLDAPGTPAHAVVLHAATALAGPAAWWPQLEPTLFGTIARRIAGAAPPRPATPRPDHFADSGMTLLRDGAGADEIWLRCDGGPHGFLSIAAHGHADALSVELRHGGTEILADPGTYCYHGEPAWRAYFRGTLGHNTLSVDDADQARSGGPFLWLDRPATSVTEHELSGPVLSWAGWHDGYRAHSGATHCRQVRFDTVRRTVEIVDWIEADAARPVALAFHLGPLVELELQGASALLRWPGHRARLRLPPELSWRAACGQTEPPLGWHSPGFGRKQPAWTLVGRGAPPPGFRLRSVLTLPPIVEASPSCELTSAAAS